MSRITELYQSKQTAAPGRGFFFFSLLSARVGGETGGHNVLFTWV